MALSDARPDPAYAYGPEGVPRGRARIRCSRYAAIVDASFGAPIVVRNVVLIRCAG